MIQKEKVERAIRRIETVKCRKHNIANYFLKFSRFHRTWLKELAEKYKAKGEFPVIPMYVLPSYYTDRRDKEIAVFAGLFLKDDGKFERIQAFHEMLGDSPWKWFKDREFVRLSIGKEQNKRTGGVLNWKISRLMNYLHDHIPVMRIVNNTRLADQYIMYNRGGLFQHLYVTDFLEDIKKLEIGIKEDNIRMLTIVLGGSDGFSQGLWTIPPHEMKCPLTEDVVAFLRMWFPDYKRYGTEDEAISLFGFANDTDFYYAYLGYKELQKMIPKACSEYATTYLRWYENLCRTRIYKWREKLPEICI